MKLESFIKGQLFLILILFSFGQLGRITLLGGSAVLYLYEAAMVSLLVLLMTVYKLKPLAFLLDTYKSIGIFLGILLLTFILSLGRYTSSENFVAFLYLFRVCIYFMFFAYTSYLLKKESSIREFVKLPTLIFLTLTIIASALQYFLYPDLRNLFYLGWDPHLYRVFGTFFEPVIAASIFGMSAIFIFLKRDFISNKTIAYTYTAVLLLLLVLTYTRSVILAITGTAIVYFMRKKIVYAGLFVVLIIAILFIVPKKSGEGVNLLRTSTIFSRSVDMQEGLKLAAQNPVFGIGYNHIRYEKAEKDPLNHAASGFQSSFLIILVTSGFLGLISFIYMLYELSRTNMITAYLVGFVSFVSLFDNVLLHPFILFLLFFLISLSNYPSNSSR